MHWKQELKHKKMRQMFEANEMKVLRKVVGKTKIDRIRRGSNLLMIEWKEEEENATNKNGY